jgi:hypothetical protein
MKLQYDLEIVGGMVLPRSDRGDQWLKESVVVSTIESIVKQARADGLLVDRNCDQCIEDGS